MHEQKSASNGMDHGWEYPQGPTRPFLHYLFKQQAYTIYERAEGAKRAKHYKNRQMPWTVELDQQINEERKMS